MRPARFLVSREDLWQAQLVLSSAELRHLRVRRISCGEIVWLTDGRGNERLGRVLRVERSRAVIELLPGQDMPRESSLAITLCLALFQPTALEFALQKTTELGVSRFLLFPAYRSVTRGSVARVSRWQRIVAEATKQCQRTVVPQLTMAESLQAAIPELAADVRLVLSPEATFHPDTLAPTSPESVALVVGPEGGLTGQELALLEEARFVSVSLGPRILRAETAAISGVTIAQYVWGDFRPGNPGGR